MINKVVVNWEAAYRKKYDILVSVYGKQMHSQKVQVGNCRVHKKFTENQHSPLDSANKKDYNIVVQRKRYKDKYKKAKRSQRDGAQQISRYAVAHDKLSFSYVIWKER